MESDFIRKSKIFENLVSKEEISKELGIAVKTVSNWMSSGRIPSIKIGRKNFALKSVLRVWLEDCNLRNLKR